MAVTVNGAGRKGGLKVLNTRGHHFFVKIGKKGQKSMRKKYPGMASVWGRKGGRPRKQDL